MQQLLQGGGGLRQGPDQAPGEAELDPLGRGHPQPAPGETGGDDRPAVQIPETPRASTGSGAAGAGGGVRPGAVTAAGPAGGAAGGSRSAGEVRLGRRGGGGLRSPGGGGPHGGRNRGGGLPGGRGDPRGDGRFGLAGGG